MSVPNVRRSELVGALRNDAIITPDKQAIVGRNGATLGWLLDTKKVLLQSRFLVVAAELFWDLYGDLLPFQIAGLELSSVPLLSAILVLGAARGKGLNSIIIRKERKPYGTGSLIEGVLSSDPVIMIDDILNSGRSMDKMFAVLTASKANILAAFVVVDYQSTHGIAWRKSRQIEIRSICSLKDLGLALSQRPQREVLATFRLQWHFKSNGASFHHQMVKSTPYVTETYVYFGSDSGSLWCLSSLTGQKIWNFETISGDSKGIVSSPTFWQSRIYCGSYDGNVYCVDALTGEELWRFCEADWVGSSPVADPVAGLVFIGLEFANKTERGAIVALRLIDGKKVWELPVPAFVHATPAIWSNMKLVACSDNDGNIYLLSSDTGGIIFKFSTSMDTALARPIRGGPVFDTERHQIIAGDESGYIFIIDVKTGEELWRTKTGNAIRAVPLIINKFAIIGSTDKHLYIIDLDIHRIVKRLYVGAKIFGAASLVNGHIMFATSAGLVYELDAETFEVTGSHQLSEGVASTITYSKVHDFIYIHTNTNELLSLKRQVIETSVT